MASPQLPLAMAGADDVVRVARVARTIADLEQSERVSEDNIVEALGFRSRSAEAG